MNQIKTLAKQMMKQKTDEHQLPTLKINQMKCDVVFSKRKLVHDFFLEIESTDVYQEEDGCESQYRLYGTPISYGETW